jgi:hypothetical protein
MPSTNNPNRFGTSQLPGNFNDTVKRDRHLQEAAAKIRREMTLSEPFHRFDQQVKALGSNARLSEYERFSVNGLNEEDQARINDLKGLEKSLQRELQTIRTHALQKQTENLETIQTAMETAGLEAVDKSRPTHDKPSKGPTPPGGHAPEKDPDKAKEDAEDDFIKGIAYETDSFLQQRLISTLKHYEPQINEARSGYFRDEVTLSKESSRSKTQAINRDEHSR